MQVCQLSHFALIVITFVIDDFRAVVGTADGDGNGFAVAVIFCSGAVGDGDIEGEGDIFTFTEELSNWYDQLSSLPRASLLKLVRLGSGVAKLLGR